MSQAYNIFLDSSRRRQIRAYLLTAAPPAVYSEEEISALHVPETSRMPLHTSPARTVLSDDWVKRYQLYCSWVLGGSQVPVTCAGLRLRWEPVPGMTTLYEHLGFVMFDQPISLTVAEPVLEVRFDVLVVRRQQIGG